VKLSAVQELGALNLLKGLPLFAACPEAPLQAIVRFLDAKEVSSGKVFLMIRRSRGHSISSSRIGGRVEAHRWGEKQLATLKAPDFFGERSMLEEAPASALVKVEGPVSVRAGTFPIRPGGGSVPRHP